MPGKYFEDLEVGQRFRHANGRTVTECDNVDRTVMFLRRPAR